MLLYWGLRVEGTNVVEMDRNGRFPEDDFDLESYKRKVLVRKRELYWKRNRWLFNVVSIASLAGLFVVAYFAYVFVLRL